MSGLPLRTLPMQNDMNDESSTTQAPKISIGDNERQSLVDLDDHRLQPYSLPRIDMPPRSPRARRGTLGSIYNQHQDLNLGDAALDESAILDDDKSIRGSPIDATVMFAHQGAKTPAVPRRSTNRRSKPNHSRESSASRSTSPSPPNSVHAFAAGSRPRAGTANSRCASVNDSIHRTVSGGTQSRRPTFSGRDEKDMCADEEAADDVCYPQSESNHGDDHSIDFEDLEEFVRKDEDDQLSVKYEAPAQATALRSGLVDYSSLEDLEKQTPPPRADSVASRRTIRPKALKRWYTFFSSELDDTIHATSIGGLLEDGETFRNLFKLGPEGGCWWLDSLNATEEEVFALCKAFGVHPLTREDIITGESREKVELFKKYYFVSFRSYDMDKESEEYLEPMSVYAIVFKQGLLTFTFNPNPHTKNVLKRIGLLRDYMALSSDWICYALIDDIVDSFLPPIRDIEVVVDNIEDQVFSARPEDARPILHKIAECRKRAMLVLRLLGSKPDVIKGFAKRCNEQYSAAPRGDVGLYLSDIQDHVVTMRDNVNHSEQLVSRLHNNFLAQINLDHIQQGNHVNKILGKVTLIATILVPLNLVTGLFGMNVAVPGKNDNSLTWFGGIIGFLVLFCVTALAVFKRLRLI